MTNCFQIFWGNKYSVVMFQREIIEKMYNEFNEEIDNSKKYNSPESENIKSKKLPTLKYSVSN